MQLHVMVLITRIVRAIYIFVSRRAHRALINVWIPSVFLQGRAANAYHVYQVQAALLFTCLSERHLLLVSFGSAL